MVHISIAMSCKFLSRIDGFSHSLSTPLATFTHLFRGTIDVCFFCRTRLQVSALHVQEFNSPDYVGSCSLSIVLPL